MLRQDPRVTSVTSTGNLPGLSFNTNLFQVEAVPGDEGMYLLTLEVGYDFTQTLGIAFAEGRPFSRAVASDSTALILNERAVQSLGLKQPLGQTLTQPVGISGPRSGQVIGVVKDFHVESLHEAIESMVLRLSTQPAMLAVRIRPGAVASTLASLKRAWEARVPDRPFAYFFLDQGLQELYQADQRTGRLVSLFAGLAILIACLGLFGLSVYAAEQRTKEIGIRKVLGASVPGLVALLSKDFLRLVAIAFVVAAPVAYLVMERWLAGFAYRTTVDPAILALAGALAVSIALLTMSYQAIKAALSDPVRSLR